MRKVLFVATVTGHINAFHIPYLKLFKENGYEVHVASNGEEEIEYCDKHYNIPFDRSPFKIQNMKAYKELKKIMEQNKYEIIHCHTPVGGVLTRLAARRVRKNGTRVLYTAHGFHFFTGAPLINWLIYYPIERFLARYTDTLITINEEDYQRAKKFKAKQVELVHGVGVDESRFQFQMTEEEKEEYRKSIGLEKDDFVLICVGELNKNKNQIMQLEAMRELIKENSKIKLLLAGEGELKEFYQNKIQEYELENNVFLLGYRKDIPQLLKISDCLLATSYREGLPVNVMEAIIAGLPVIATNCRGQRDLVNQENIIPINDVVELKDKIKDLLLEPKKFLQIEVSFPLTRKEIMKRMRSIYDITSEEDNVLRVLHVIRAMNVGGAETLIMNLYRNIDRTKVQFDFLVSREGTYDEEILKMGGNIFKIPYLTDVGQITYVKKLKQFFRTHKYTIIHSHIDQVSGIIVETAYKCNIPIRISHSHSTGNTNHIIGKIYKKYLQGKIEKNANYYFACGQQAAEWLYPKKNANSIYIKNGVDTKKFLFSEEKRGKIRKELQIQETDIIIGHVGSFLKVKNQKFLLEVFKEYHNLNPNSYLLLVGEGPLKNEIQQQAIDLNIGEYVKFLGLRNDVDYLYSAFDILVFPSLYEGVSTVLIEAQSAGLNIYASDKIAEETNITGTINFLKLTDNAKTWANNIISNSIQRYDNKQYIIQANYDIENIAKELQKKYISFVREISERKSVR